VIDELVVGIEEIGLGRPGGTQRVGNLVSVILRIGKVRCFSAAWALTAAVASVELALMPTTLMRGFVVLSQFFHPLVVGIGNRALDRDEDQYRAVLAFERVE